jgi:restriction system protein
VSAGQLYRFVHEVREGDVVVYSSNRDQTVRFARVDGGYQVGRLTSIRAGFCS